MEGSTSYDAYLEGTTGGLWRARILDFSGCWADGATEQDALATLTASIPTYFAWLRTHDEYTPVVAGPFELRPRESQPALLFHGRATGAFFAPDAAPLTDEEIEWELALLGWAYDDLLAAASSTGTSPAAETALAGIAQAQLSLLASFDQPLVPGGEASGVTAATLLPFARAVLASLRRATPEQRSVVRESAGERWSLRKVLRRSIELVREHTPRGIPSENGRG